MMFTGTSQQQDTRFSDKEKKLMKQMRFGDCLNKRVDMSKVKLDVLRPWISKKITDFLHIEDDVVVEFVYNQLEEEKFPCPKKMQINMTGFLNGRNARQFMDELWALLLSAQDSETGIPVEFINQKKDEIMMRKEENSLLDASKISDDSTILKDMLKASIKSSGEYLNLVPKEKSRSRSRESNFGKEAVQDVRREKIRSPRQKSREGSQIKNYSSRDRVSRKRNSRDRSGDREANDNDRGRDRDRDNRARGRDRERNRQRSLSRIVDRKRRRSYSKDKKGNDRNLNTNSSRKKSRSASKQRERGGSKSKSKSSALVTKSSPKTRNATTEKIIDDTDGNKNPGIEKSQKLSKVQAKLLTLATSGLKKRDSRSRSRSNSTLFKKQLKRSTTSKSLEKSKKKSRSVSSSSSNSSTSSSDSSKDNEVNKKNRSYSSSSFSKSPENKRERLEINKKHDSVQKKRHYRRNKKSSSSVSPDKLAYRRHQQKKNFGAAKRQSYPRGGSPIGKGGRQRSRSPRQRSRSRNRSRSLMRSPKRFQRRSPFPSMKRGRGSRIRSNIRRQSPIRERGRLNQSPRVRRSPWDRRSPARSFNRDRRSPPFRNKQSPFYERRSSGAHEGILSPYREKRLSPIRDRKMTTIRNRRSPFSNRDRRISASREKRVSDFRERKSQVRNRQNSTERFQQSRRLSVDKNYRTNSSSDRENRVSPTTNKLESFRSGKTDEDDSNQNRKITENLDEPSDICLLKKKSASNKESNSIFGGSTVEKTEIGMQSEHSQMKLIIKKSNLLSNISDSNENKLGLSTNISSEHSKEFKDTTNNSKDVEKIFNSFSLSLSRTPSPFLKSYEKEKQKNDKSMLSKNSIKKIDMARNVKSKIRRISSTSDGSSDSHTEKEEKQYKSDSSSNEYVIEKNMANKINDEKILDTNVPKNQHLTEYKQGKHVKIKSVEKNDQILHSEIKFSDRKVFEKMEKPNPEIKSNNNSSDLDQKSKKKLKRNKKTNSKESDVESSSDSDTEMKKKKHKKHKKHGKRNKKHKKHKKKSKRNNSSDSAEEDYDFSKVPRPVINDDLEKQLRERALKSMKKQTSISD